MRLVLPEPIGQRAGAIDLAPGVTLRVHPTEPLRLDLDRWRARAIGAARIVTTERFQTEAGWAATAVRVADPAALYTFFELFDRGVVVVAKARDDAALDAALDSLNSLLRAADVDRTQREIVAIAQIWSEG